MLVNKLVINKLNRMAHGTNKTIGEQELEEIIKFCETRREPLTVETFFAVWVTGGHKRTW